MTDRSYTLDVTTRPVGRNYGGKNGTSIACPVCGRAALKHKTVRVDGLWYVDYAHMLSIDLNARNEPVLTASQICRKPERDPSPTRGKRGK